MPRKFGTSIAVLHTEAYDNGYSDFERIQFLSDLGFKFIDYHLGEEYSERAIRDIPFLGDNWEKWCRDIRDFAVKCNCCIHQTHAPVLEVFSDRNTEKEAAFVLDRAIRVSALMGANVIVLHPVNVPSSWRDDELGLKKNAAFIRERAEVAKIVGIRIAVENMLSNRLFNGSVNKRICDNYSSLDKLVSRIAFDNVGFCLDIGHACYMGWDIPSVIQKMNSRLFALHIHDNDTFNDEHLAPMTGIGKWTEILNALKCSNFDGVLTLETLNFCRNHPKELHISGLKYLVDICQWMAEY